MATKRCVNDPVKTLVAAAVSRLTYLKAHIRWEEKMLPGTYLLRVDSFAAAVNMKLSRLCRKWLQHRHHHRHHHRHLHRHRHHQCSHFCERSQRHLNAVKARDSHHLRDDHSHHRLARARSLAHQMCSCGTCSVSWRKNGKWPSSCRPSRLRLHTRFSVSATPAASHHRMAALMMCRVGAKFHHHHHQSAVMRHSCLEKSVRLGVMRAEHSGSCEHLPGRFSSLS